MIAINKDIIATIGVDLGKNTFHICAMNDKGTILLRERLTRAALPKRLANIPPCRIGMEASPDPITLAASLPHSATTFA